MRYTALIAALAILISTFASCKKEDKSKVSPVGGTAIGGDWRVSYFYDNDKDETSDYNGYVFRFNSNGSMTATRSGQTTNGSWNETSDDGFKKFIISLNTSDDKLTELNDDWVLESKTSTEIKLKDDNPARNEQLHFVKQ